MSDKPSFNIQLSTHIVQVTLRGKWSLSQDMAYLSQLAQGIDQIKAKPWGMLVDMRHWQLKQIQHFDYQQKQVADVHIDRRNQKAECWIVREPNQAQALLKFIDPKLAFIRVESEQQAITWLKQFDLVAHDIPQN